MSHHHNEFPALSDVGKTEPEDKDLERALHYHQNRVEEIDRQLLVFRHIHGRAYNQTSRRKANAGASTILAKTCRVTQELLNQRDISAEAIEVIQWDQKDVE